MATAELANHLCHDRDQTPHSHPLRALKEPAFKQGRKFIQHLHRQAGLLARHFSLRGKATFTYTSADGQGASDAANYSSKDQVVRTIRAIQRNFADRPFSGDPVYSADARAFAVDTGALIGGGMSLCTTDRG
jgi:hypothetical protein